MTTTTLLLGLVGGVAVFVAVIALTGGTDRQSTPVLSRLERYLSPSHVEMPDFPEPNRLAANLAIRATIDRMGGSKLAKSKPGGRLADRLAAAGVKLRPAEWYAISAAVAVLAGALAELRFGSPIGFVVAAALGYFGTQAYLRRRVATRKKLFERQLGPAVLSISNGVKAGYTFAQAIDLVGKTAPAPMGPELMRVTREQQLGVPIQEALSHMVARNDSEDLRLMLTAVQIQQQVGGNLAGILDSIEFTIRERVRIKGEIQTLTGQARASGWILIILPFALAGILQMVAPSYFAPMVKSGLGLGMLGFAAFMLMCGYAIIRKIVNVTI